MKAIPRLLINRKYRNLIKNYTNYVDNLVSVGSFSNQFIETIINFDVIKTDIKGNHSIARLTYMFYIENIEVFDRIENDNGVIIIIHELIRYTEKAILDLYKLEVKKTDILAESFIKFLS